jgi:YVTN family beta-propeller protein
VLSASKVIAHYNAGIAHTAATTTPSSATLAEAATAVGVGGTSPVATAFDPAIDRLYVSRNDGLTNGVAVIDPREGTVVAQITTGRWAPGAIAVNTVTHLAYVTAAAYGARDDQSMLTVIDGRTDAVVETIPVAPGPKAVAVDARTNRVYVTSASGTDGGQAVSVIDGATGVTIATIPAGTYARYFDNPFGLAVDAVADRIYATNPLDGTVHVIDGATNTEVRSVTIGGRPTSLAVDEKTHVVAVAYAVNGKPAVGIIDGPTAALAASIALTSDARGLVFDASHNVFYATTAAGAVATLDADRARLTGVDVAGSSTYGVAFDDSSGTLAVVDDVDGIVWLRGRHPAGFS